MGGGVRSSCSFSSSPDDHSSLDDDNSHCSSDGLGLEFVEEAEIPSGFYSGEFDQMSYQGDSSNHVPFAGNLRTRLALKANLIKSHSYSYRDSLARTESLNEAKRLLLSYTPCSWIDKEQGEKLSDFGVPKATTLLVVGFKGSGKSSLINRISRVFEDENLASDRAQVSYCSSLGDGTHFLYGYVIPRRSGSFCLFDTRGLSDETHENDEMIKSWMTNGVRNGELVIRESDDPSVRDMLKCKIRDGNELAEPIKKVNFVIFAINGHSVLRYMNSNKEEDIRRAEMLARSYNSSYLSYRDDKPVIVVTHGDLLSHEERARVRIYLGEILGVPPATQIFDIPESRDPVTELATLEMLKYALEHADKNLPHRRWTCRNLSPAKWSLGQGFRSFFISLIPLVLALLINVAMIGSQTHFSHCAPLSNSPLHCHDNDVVLVNRTLDHPAQTQFNSTTQATSFCNHHQHPETTRETNPTVNLDLSNSTTQSNSSHSDNNPPTKLQDPQEQPAPVEPKNQEQPAPVEPKTPKTKHKSRARKHREAAVLEPTIDWEARKRLWLVE